SCVLKVRLRHNCQINISSNTPTPLQCHLRARSAACTSRLGDASRLDLLSNRPPRGQSIGKTKFPVSKTAERVGEKTQAGRKTAAQARENARAACHESG